ncbi:hypothetical protein LINPERHAP2_LOCUS39864 [Linum perenne]
MSTRKTSSKWLQLKSLISQTINYNPTTFDQHQSITFMY